MGAIDDSDGGFPDPEQFFVTRQPVSPPFGRFDSTAAALVRQLMPDSVTACHSEQPQLSGRCPTAFAQPNQHLIQVFARQPFRFGHGSIPFTTRASSTPVNRSFRPLSITNKSSWFSPSRCRIVACQ